MVWNHFLAEIIFTGLRLQQFPRINLPLEEKYSLL